MPFESIELWLTEDTTVPAFERTARLGSDPKIRRPIFLVRPTHHDPDKATAAEAPSPHPGSGVHSAKLLVGTRQRFTGLSYMRRCGDDVLRMFVTGGLPVRGGAGIPHRIVTIAVAGFGVTDGRGRVVGKEARRWRQVAMAAMGEVEEKGIA